MRREGAPAELALERREVWSDADEVGEPEPGQVREEARRPARALEQLRRDAQLLRELGRIDRHELEGHRDQGAGRRVATLGSGRALCPRAPPATTGSGIGSRCGARPCMSVHVGA